MKSSLIRFSAHVFCALIFLGAGARAAGTATVDLSGATFGNHRDVHLSSGATSITAAPIYDYAISGKVHGSGLLAPLLPVGTDLADLLNRIQPGSSSILRGTRSNPGGVLPFTIVDRTFAGTIPITPFLNATARVHLVARVSSIGQIRFHVVNVEFSVPGIADIGTVTFEPGSKVVVSAVPIVEFKSAAVSVPENVGTLSVRVRRKFNTDKVVTVHYSSAPATATANDFDAVSGDLSFGVGELVKVFDVTIKNRPGVQGNRVFRLRLSDPSGAIIGAIQKETVTITDVR